MSMKQAFSAAGIAAAVLLSGAAYAEKLQLNLEASDEYGYSHYWRDWTNEEPSAGFFIGISSSEGSSVLGTWTSCNGDASQFLYCNSLSLRDYTPSLGGRVSLMDGNTYDGIVSRHYYFSEIMYATDDTRLGYYDLIDGHLDSFVYNDGKGNGYSYSSYDDYEGTHHKNYEHYYDNKFISNAPFDVDALFNTLQDTFPVSGYGIFDFQNTVIHYADHTSASLAQIMTSDSLYEFALNGSSMDRLVWSSDSPITSITIAYAVPEPETWAMLLAGLGLIGGVARRRGLRA